MPLSNIVAVTSGKGGTGKSTFSVNLAIAAADSGLSVLLIDMDAGMRCLDMMLGVSDSVLMDIGDVIDGADFDRTVIQIAKYPRLSFLPAPSNVGKVSPNGLKGLIDKVRDNFSLVIIDFPAGSDYTLYDALPLDTKFLCICNPNPVSVRDAALCGQAIRKIDRKGYLIINRYNYKHIANDSFKTLDDIINETGLRLLGIVPESRRLSNAFCNRKFPRKGKEAKAFRRILMRIEGRSIPLLKLKKI